VKTGRAHLVLDRKERTMTDSEAREQFERFMAAAITGLCSGLTPAQVEARADRIIGAASVIAATACNDVNGRWPEQEGQLH
jgi:hypothetical protein